MIQKVLGITGVPSPFKPNNCWVYTLECGHLHIFILQEPEATQAANGWFKAFALPKGEARTAVKTLFDEQTFIPKEVDCKNCDTATDYSLFDFFKDEA